MSTTYNKEQQIHSLSLLTNAAYDMQMPSLAALQNFTTTVVNDCLADSIIQGCIGSDWTPVWGPIVFSKVASQTADATNVVSDNTLALYYSPSQNLFVVGIAGTNIVSTYGWFQEDFQVSSSYGWGQLVHKIFLPPFPMISMGSYTGLQILLGLTDPSHSGQTMLQCLSAYLSNHATAVGAEVAVAGHSLGGALAPVLAMYMQDTHTNWNTSKVPVTISAWPTAGPTPGDQGFASYVANAMGSNYVSHYNPLDVIPHAWGKASMGQIPTIYESNIPPISGASPSETILGSLVLAAFLDSARAEMIYTQIQPWNQLPGSAFDTATDQGITDMFNKYKLELDLLLPSSYPLSQYLPYVENLARFLAQMAFQHTTAYNTLLGIEAFAAEFKVVKTKDTPAGAPSEQAMHDYALNLALQGHLGFSLNSLTATVPAAAPAASA